MTAADAYEAAARDVFSTPTAELYAWLDREPRHVVERMLVGELLDQQQWVVDDVCAAVPAEVIHNGALRTIYETIGGLRDDRETVDLVNVIDRLTRDGHLEAVGGLRALTALRTQPRQWGMTTRLAEHLLELQRREKLSEAGAQIAARAQAGDVDVDDVAAVLEPLAHPERQHGVEVVSDALEGAYVHVAEGDKLTGTESGWSHFDALYRADRRLWTVVTGIPSSGKSTWLDNLCVRLARQGWRFAMFSPESSPTGRHVARLATIAAGVPLHSTDQVTVQGWFDWVGEHFEWITSTDGVTLPEILRRADVIHRRRPIDGLVLDPWNEIEHQRPRDVTEAQYISESLTQYRRWVRRRGAHGWIVAHPTKQERRKNAKALEDPYSTPDLYAVLGSATWRDKSDMGIVVHRNQADPLSPTWVHVQKVRFPTNGRMGKTRLEFTPSTLTFSEGRFEGRSL